MENEAGNSYSVAVEYHPLNGRLKFLREIEKASREKITKCYQCGKCTAGCPVAFAMDYTPNQIMRMIQLGLKKKVISSRTIWLCASCHTCVSRCPRDINLPKIMDVLRKMSIEANTVPKEITIPKFNSIFLNSVKKYGRLFEPELIGLYNIATKQFFKDFSKIIPTLLRRKMKFFPNKSKDNKKIKTILNKV